MIINKKNLLVLAAIPLYLSFCYISVAFNDAKFNLSNILCVSAFTLCAALISAISKRVIKLCGLVLIHICLVGISLLFPQAELTFQTLFVYCLFSLPSLMIMIILFESKNQLNENDESVGEKKKSFFQKPALFSYCIEALAIVFAGILISGKEVVSFEFNKTAGCFLVMLLLLIVYYLSISIGKGNDNEKSFAAMLSIMSAFSFVVYIIWANRYVDDFVYLLLPQVVITVFVIEKYPAAFAFLKQNAAKKQCEEK